MQNVIFVVGVPQSGGCYIPTGDFFLSREDAELKIRVDRSNGISFTRIFELKRRSMILEMYDKIKAENPV